MSRRGGRGGGGGRGGEGEEGGGDGKGGRGKRRLLVLYLLSICCYKILYFIYYSSLIPRPRRMRLLLPLSSLEM